MNAEDRRLATKLICAGLILDGVAITVCCTRPHYDPAGTIGSIFLAGVMSQFLYAGAAHVILRAKRRSRHWVWLVWLLSPLALVAICLLKDRNSTIPSVQFGTEKSS